MTSVRSRDPSGEKLRFQPGHDTTVPDVQLLSDEDLKRAQKKGVQQG
jgi:hypothetical protein